MLNRMFLFVMMFASFGFAQEQDIEVTWDRTAYKGQMDALRSQGLNPLLYTELRKVSVNGPTLGCETEDSFELRSLPSQILWLPANPKVNQAHLKACLAVEHALFGSKIPLKQDSASAVTTVTNTAPAANGTSADSQNDQPAEAKRESVKGTWKIKVGETFHFDSSLPMTNLLLMSAATSTLFHSDHSFDVVAKQPGKLSILFRMGNLDYDYEILMEKLPPNYSAATSIFSFVAGCVICGSIFMFCLRRQSKRMQETISALQPNPEFPKATVPIPEPVIKEPKLAAPTPLAQPAPVEIGALPMLDVETPDEETTALIARLNKDSVVYPTMRDVQVAADPPNGLATLGQALEHQQESDGRKPGSLLEQGHDFKDPNIQKVLASMNGNGQAPNQGRDLNR